VRLLFHIGMAKTGSSALQAALAGSAEALARRGVLYPRDPAQPNRRNHKLYATLTGPLAALPRHMARLGGPEEVQARLAEFHAAIEAEVAARQPRLLLLSAETMFTGIRRGYGRRLRRTFCTFDPQPGFVVYLRAPADRYVSGLQQHLKASAAVPMPRPSHYRRNISGYEQVFGAGCVALHLFHRAALAEGDIVEDFRARHLAPYGVTPADLTRHGDMNVGLGPESMAVMQAYRARFHAGRDDRASGDSDRLRDRLRAADTATGAGRPRLRPEIARLVDYASDDPLWLRDRHGIVFPDFDYTPLEAGYRAAPPERPLRLEEIIVTDPARLRGILEHLAADRWARSPERAAWVAEFLAGLPRQTAAPNPA
jgi:hypothetical protein